LEKKLLFAQNVGPTTIHVKPKMLPPIEKSGFASEVYHL